jgi:hypothetical protein
LFGLSVIGNHFQYLVTAITFDDVVTATASGLPPLVVHMMGGNVIIAGNAFTAVPHKLVGTAPKEAILQLA